jgi:diketogulonate reductase-like aldo/keto reductase
MLTKKELSKIGIGTWGIGGFAEKDTNLDTKKQIEALVYAFQNGLNYLDLNLWYAQGYSVELVLEAFKLSGIRRTDLFITQKFYPFSINSIDDAKKELEKLKKSFSTDYIDSAEVTTTLYDKLKYDGVVEFVKYALENGCRYTNITNASIDQLKQYHEEFGNKLFASEVGFNFEVRENITNGVIPYAESNGILNVVYQPLRRNRTALRNWPLLSELSVKYQMSQNQILLNWISSKGYLPITKAGNIEHLKEAINSMEFKMLQADIDRLNNFKIENYKSPKVFYTIEGSGVRVDQLSNIFDEEYDKQQQTS